MKTLQAYLKSKIDSTVGERNKSNQILEGRENELNR